MARSGFLKPVLWIFGGSFVAMMAIILVAVMITAYLKGPRQWRTMVADLQTRGEPVWVEDLDWEEPDPATSFFGVPPFDALWEPIGRYEAALEVSEIVRESMQLFTETRLVDTYAIPGLKHGCPMDLVVAMVDEDPPITSKEDAARLILERFKKNADFFDALERAIARPNGALSWTDPTGEVYFTNSLFPVSSHIGFLLWMRGLAHLDLGEFEPAA